MTLAFLWSLYAVWPCSCCASLLTGAKWRIQEALPIRWRVRPALCNSPRPPIKVHMGVNWLSIN